MANTQAAYFFRSVPWTAALLDQPNLVVFINDSRTPKSSNEDALMAVTFNTPTTLPASLTFHQRPASNDLRIDRISMLWKVGTGLDGWPQILHGGIVASLIDEAMGVLLFANVYRHRRIAAKDKEFAKRVEDGGQGGFTAELKVTYKAPVITPGVVLSTASFVRVEGRKRWLSCDIIQFDDTKQQQVLCAVGEALFIAKRAQL